MTSLFGASSSCAGDNPVQLGLLQIFDPLNDLHLVVGSYAVDRGASSSTATTDIDGTSRPKGTAVDAGADER